MTDPFLPCYVTVQVAAKLVGLSPRTFSKAYLVPGLVRVTHVDDGRAKVVLASLAALLGRDITVEDYLAAERELERRRAWQRDYRQRQRRYQRGVASGRFWPAPGPSKERGPW